MLHLLMASLRESSADGLFLALWGTGVWRLMLFLLIYSTGLAIIFPITPTLVTNGFASLAAGHPIDCTTYSADDAPPECDDAHATVAIWMSWTNFFSSSLLSFFCAPYVGHLSDRIGRKPFMLAGITLMFLPLAVIQLHLHGVLPIYWYYPASAAGGVVSSFTMTLTSVADLLEQRHRATAVGYLTSCFSVGMLIGPVLGGYLSVTTALWTCIATTAVTLAFVAIFVPESAPGPVARRDAAKAAQTAAAGAPPAGESADAKVAAAVASAAPVPPAAAAVAGQPQVRKAAVARRASTGGGGGMYGRWDGEGCDDDAAAAAAAAAVLAAVEGVSLVSAQQHLISGAAPPPAGAAAVEGAVGACVQELGGIAMGRTSPEPQDGRGSRAGTRSCRTSEYGSESQPLLWRRRCHSGGGAVAVATAGELSAAAAGAGHGGSSNGGVGGSGSESGSGSGGKAAGAERGDGPSLAGLMSGWAVIRGSSFYQRIAAIWVVVSMTWEGAGELLMQYLQLKLAYDTRDQANVLIVLASGGLVVKLGLLALLVRWLGERRLLAFGLTAYAAECVALAVAPTKGLALAAVSIGSLASVCWPALVALQTAGVDPRQQGAVFGALQAISSMASGLGPLLFARVFQAGVRQDKHSAMTGLVWFMAAGMALVAIMLTLTLPQPAGGESGSAGEEEQQREGQGKGRGGGAGGRADWSEDLEEGRGRGAAAPEGALEGGAASGGGGLREPLLQS